MDFHQAQPKRVLPSVAIITGGGQGIGKGIATRLVSEGMDVVIFDIDRDAVEETAAELGSTVVPVHGDVSRESDVARVMRLISTRFGRLDVLVNNAGNAPPKATPIESLSLDDWYRVIATNLTGIFLCCKHAVPLLRPARGTIINIASTRALQSEAHTEAYSASKGGVVALTHALAISLGPAIRVNCISPGWIAVDDWQKSSERVEPHLTPRDHSQHPVGRVGAPKDIAAMTAFLSSPGAGFITGQNFVIDGGMTRRMIYTD